MRDPSSSCHDVTTTHCITPTAGRDGSTSDIDFDRAREPESGAIVRIIRAVLTAVRSRRVWSFGTDLLCMFCRLLGSEATSNISCGTFGVCRILLVKPVIRTALTRT